MRALHNLDLYINENGINSGTHIISFQVDYPSPEDLLKRTVIFEEAKAKFKKETLDAFYSSDAKLIYGSHLGNTALKNRIAKLVPPALGVFPVVPLELGGDPTRLVVMTEHDHARLQNYIARQKPADQPFFDHEQVISIEVSNFSLLLPRKNGRKVLPLMTDKHDQTTDIAVPIPGHALISSEMRNKGLSSLAKAIEIQAQKDAVKKAAQQALQRQPQASAPRKRFTPAPRIQPRSVFRYAY